MKNDIYELAYNTHRNMTDSIFYFENQKSINAFHNQAYIDYNSFFSLDNHNRMKASKILKQLFDLTGEELAELDFDLWFDGVCNDWFRVL